MSAFDERRREVLSREHDAIEVAFANVMGALNGDDPPDLGRFHTMPPFTLARVISCLLAVMREVSHEVGTEPFEQVIQAIGWDTQAAVSDVLP